MEIVGGIRAYARNRLVVKYSGDDWETYELLDPADPKSEFGGLFPILKSASASPGAVRAISAGLIQ